MIEEIINIDKLQEVYTTASTEQKAELEKVFNKEILKPQKITDRIKTFEDACTELGDNHPLVLAYKNTNLRDDEVTFKNKDVIAYLKLRIIVSALNEDWEPQFILGEYRWYPYFILYTKDEVEELDEETRARMVFRSVSSASVYGGVSNAYASNDASDENAVVGSRLAFKTEDLADYAGKQFIEIYADFMLGWELKK